MVNSPLEAVQRSHGRLTIWDMVNIPGWASVRSIGTLTRSNFR